MPADALAAEVDGLADRLARTPPEVMGPTKRMLNRAMDVAGFRLAVEAGLDLGAIINAADTPEQREWDAIVRRDGLKAALAWRDRRYDERLGRGERGGGGTRPVPSAVRSGRGGGLPTDQDPDHEDQAGGQGGQQCGPMPVNAEETARGECDAGPGVDTSQADGVSRASARSASPR